MLRKTDGDSPKKGGKENKEQQRRLFPARFVRDGGLSDPQRGEKKKEKVKKRLAKGSERA